MPPLLTMVHIEDSPKRIRVFFGGVFIVDTKKAKLVWEKPYYPTYFFPHTDLSPKYVEANGSGNGSPETELYDVVVGERRAKQAVTKYVGKDTELQGLLKITFGAMDAWFEEEEEIFVHPKDPYKRVDVLQSSRHIRIEVNGVEVANTTSPRLLYETTLPVRTYIKKTDCRLDLFMASSLTTQCPYKGEANYHHVKAGPSGKIEKDIVWCYRNPTLECSSVRGYVAFYDEKVDVWSVTKV